MPATRNATYLVAGSPDNLCLATSEIVVRNGKQEKVGTFRGLVGHIFWKPNGLQQEFPIGNHHAMCDRDNHVVARAESLITGAYAVNLDGGLFVNIDDRHCILCPACGSLLKHEHPGSQICTQCGHNVYTHWPIFCKEYNELKSVRTHLRRSHPWRTEHHVLHDA